MIRTLATFAVAAVSLNAAASDDYFRNVTQSFERGFGSAPAGTRAQDEAHRRDLIASFERIAGPLAAQNLRAAVAGPLPEDGNRSVAAAGAVAGLHVRGPMALGLSRR